jgi:hypothetical protein
MNRNLRKIYEYKLPESYIPLEYYKLREWITLDKINNNIFKNRHPKTIDLVHPLDFNKITTHDKYSISANPVLIDLIKTYPEIINWDGLSLNSHPYAIELIEKKLEDPQIDRDMSRKISWYSLSTNRSAIHILKANPDKIEWGALSCNPNAIELLKERIMENLDIDNMDVDDIDINLINKQIWWSYLSDNDAAIELLLMKPDKIVWVALNNNKNAIDLLEANPDKINWTNISNNSGAGHLIEQNLDKINWKLLTNNPCAIDLVKANQDKVEEWYYLSQNPNIFTYNYELLTERISCFKEELISKIHHPKRIKKLLSMGLSIEEICEL